MEDDRRALERRLDPHCVRAAHRRHVQLARGAGVHNDHGNPCGRLPADLDQGPRPVNRNPIDLSSISRSLSMSAVFTGLSMAELSALSWAAKSFKAAAG